MNQYQSQEDMFFMKKRILWVVTLCAMMVLASSMVAYAAVTATNASVGFEFDISKKNVGYTSGSVSKTKNVHSAYTTLERHQTDIGIGTPTTAFIVVKDTGHQLSYESTATGLENFYLEYNSAGSPYIGRVCIRANATALVQMLTTQVHGTFYPDGN